MHVAGSVEQILRVNHAGERGAINIYLAQCAIAKRFFPKCVPALEEMLSHEREHFQSFDSILKERGLRQCSALWFWGVGGRILGTITAFLGPSGIWACTSAVENTVNSHLEHQIEFLQGRDSEVLGAVLAIQADEREHEQHAAQQLGRPTGIYKLIWHIVAGATGVAIWLSTKL